MPVQKPVFQYLPLVQSNSSRTMQSQPPSSFVSTASSRPSRGHDNGVTIAIGQHEILTQNDSYIPLSDPKIHKLLSAIESRSLPTIRTIVDNGVDINGHGGIFLVTPLHQACINGWVEGVRFLIERGSKVNSKNQYGQTPLHYAIVAKSIDCVKLLLNTQNSEILDSQDKRGITPLHDAAAVGFVEAISCLLKAGASIKVYDAKYKETPLHKAAKAKSIPSMMTLIRAGATLDARDGSGESVLSCTMRCFPGGMEKLLDNCIVVDPKKIREKSTEVLFNFKPLLPCVEEECNQMKNLQSIVELGQSCLLRHIVCESFLLLKWRRVRYLFFIEVIFYFFYAFMTTLLSVNKFVWKVGNTTHDSDIDDDSDTLSWEAMPSSAETVLLSIVLIQAIMIAFQQILTAVHGGIAWLYSLWHVLHLVIAFFVILVLPPWEMHDAQKQMCTILLLLLWTQCMLLIGRFPDCGIYVVMFQRVARVFVRIFAIYFCLLLAFTFSFYISMHKTCDSEDCESTGGMQVYSNVVSTFFKTLTMMIGELNYDDDFVDSLNTVPVVSHLVFLFFVILVAIILSNLLVALAVNDVQALRSSVHLERLIKQLELVFQMEENFRTVASLIMKVNIPCKSDIIDFCKHDYRNSTVYIKPNESGMNRKLCVKSSSRDVIEEIKIKKDLSDKIIEFIRSREMEVKTTSSTISIMRTRSEYSNNNDLIGNLQQLESNLLLQLSDKLDSIVVSMSSLNNRLITVENTVRSLSVDPQSPCRGANINKL